MDAKHSQSFFYVDMLLDKLIEFRSSSLEVLEILNHSTDVFLESLANITSQQHNFDELQTQYMDAEDHWVEFLKGIMDEGSMDECLLLEKIVQLKKQCFVANKIDQI
ncbi:unnamed protein product [Callosobruchus maculatus]|uniref:Uncharacterized protein n=1 Tax=Callosobruchus maculatus TaxID=64391 RepID=A0A653D125_CALMS|nr:unnamed protein product [Callosobruchus maculatus]